MYVTLNNRRHDLPGLSCTVKINDVREYFEENPNF